MSRMTRVSQLRSSVYRVPRRTVVSNPTSPFNRKIAQQGDAAPSGVARSASQFLYANFFRRNAVFLTGVIGAAGTPHTTRTALHTPHLAPSHPRTAPAHHPLLLPLFAVVFTGAYDAAMDALWEWNNQGKLFKDVIPKRFPNLPPNTEPEGGEEDAGGDQRRG